MIEFSDFEKVEIRVGKITEVKDFPEARKPAFKLKIDFGEKIGVKQSSVQIVENYSKDGLIGKLVVCVTNFHPKQIGPFISEVLVLGVPDDKGNCVLLQPSLTNVKPGSRIY